MTTQTEVQELVTRVAVLEEQVRGAEEKIQRMWEERNATNDEFRGRLNEVESMVHDLKTNTALTRQALEGITTIAADLKKDREVSTDWRAKQDAKWNKIEGAKWLLGLIVLAALGMSDAGQHLMSFLK